MTAQRALVAVLVVLCGALAFSNWRLLGRVAELEARQDGPPVALAAADAPVRAPERERMRRHRPDAVRMEGAAKSPERIEAEATKPEADHDGAHRAEPDWDALRARMETGTIDTVEAYGTQHGWEPATTEEVLGILLDSSDAIGELWSGVHTGDTTHYQARKEMHAIREATGDDIAALIGVEAWEALDEALFEARHEAMRDGHGGPGRPPHR